MEKVDLHPSHYGPLLEVVRAEKARLPERAPQGKPSASMFREIEHRLEMMQRGERWPVKYHIAGKDGIGTGTCVLCGKMCEQGDEIEVRGGGRYAAHRAGSEAAAERNAG